MFKKTLNLKMKIIFYADSNNQFCCFLPYYPFFVCFYALNKMSLGQTGCLSNFYFFFLLAAEASSFLIQFYDLWDTMPYLWLWTLSPTQLLPRETVGFLRGGSILSVCLCPLTSLNSHQTVLFW